MADKRRLTVNRRSIGSIEYLVWRKPCADGSAPMYDDARVSKLAVTFELLPKLIVECGDLVGSIAEEMERDPPFLPSVLPPFQIRNASFTRPFCQDRK
jgi:hypothetical protein